MKERLSFRFDRTTFVREDNGELLIVFGDGEQVAHATITNPTAAALWLIVKSVRRCIDESGVAESEAA